MTSSRRFRLLHTSGLEAFRRAIVQLTDLTDPWEAHRTVVLVPTAAAAAQLRRSIAAHLRQQVSPPAVRVTPQLLTREGWYREMYGRGGFAAPWLTSLERQVAMLAAARQAASEDASPPFKLRPGLVPAMVALYDQLKRHRRTVDAFDRLLTADLEPSAELDRGARRLLRQTTFLVSTFRRYEGKLAATGGLDEHGLRGRLMEGAGGAPFARVILTAADHVVDAGGLWPADFDLLSRQPGLDRVDVVVTDRVLDAGFYERVADLLPGIEEERVGGDAVTPALLVPDDTERRHFVWRDREEELLAVIRHVKTALSPSDASESTPPVPRETGVVFRRRLPYVYLARHLFEQAGVAFEALDALPLAAEPPAAALDLVCSVVTSGYGRAPLVALLRSPHFAFTVDGCPLPQDAVESLDQRLRDAHVEGGRAALTRFVDRWSLSDHGRDGEDREVLVAARVAVQVANELGPLDEIGRPSRMLECLGAFLERHASDPPVSDRIAAREARARLALWTAIADLRRAHRALDDSNSSFSEVAASLRRWIESQTFEPSTGGGGVQLVDAQAAPYGHFDDLFIVGLVDGEWPARVGRNIFYPSSLLIPLGWPPEREVLRAERARFGDLLGSPRDRICLSTISLENDAVITPSVLLEDVERQGLERVVTDVDPSLRVTRDDALAAAVVDPRELSGSAAAWLTLRSRERDPGAPQLHGFVTPQSSDVYGVRSLERYLECPFKYFAERVLKLRDERDSERLAAAQRRGLLLHGVFERFFRTWHEAGNRAITPARLDDALKMFRAVADEALPTVPPADRWVMRSWLLGSTAAPGLADRLFSLEVGSSGDVVERLTELRVDGELVVGEGDCQRIVHVRGVADRVDLFSDGTFRLVDYKANRAPDLARSLQLPLYVHCVEQQLVADDRRWRAAEAAYVAFGEPRLRIPWGQRDLTKGVDDGRRQAVAVLEAIERGEFPVRPAQPYLCTFCPYPTVCRKDYIDDE